MTVPHDDPDGIEQKINADLRRAGENSFLAWPIAIGLVWASCNYSHVWLRVATTAFLLLLFIIVCLANIGRIFTLNKMHGDVDSVYRKHLFVASIAALLVLYATVAIWSSLPFPTLAVCLVFVLAVTNSMLGKPAA